MRKYGLLLLTALLLSGCDDDNAAPVPGSLQVKTAALSATEGTPTVAVTVSRSGGSDGAVTVSYTTADGTATAGTDYTAASGILNWADGDSADKSFTVAIADDAAFDEPEDFTATLSAPTNGASLGAATTATVTIVDNDPVPLKLISFNDYHGNLNPPGSTIRAVDPADATKTVNLPAGGVEYLATLVKQFKAQNPRNAVLGAGDLIGASPLVSALFHDEPAIETLSKLGLEYSSVGNHEFDDGSTELSRMQNGGCFPGGSGDTCQNGNFTGASFKYLAANVVDLATGRSYFPGYAIKQFDIGGGEKIGVAFIGLVLKNTPNIVTPSGVAGLAFADEAGAANALVPEIKAAGVKAIVILIHEGGFSTGLYNDKSCPGLSGDVLPILDKLDPEIDIVISGHTHSAYNCTRPGGLLLTSASSFGRVLTSIDVTVDRTTKDIVSKTADNAVVVNASTSAVVDAAYPPLAKDPDQTAILTRYNDLVAPLANKVIGSISADLTRTTNLAGESSLGDVIADTQLDATDDAGFGDAVIAFMNPGGIRTDFLVSQISGGETAGQVTYGEAFTVQPFGNSLVTMTLTGAQIKTLLEQQFPPTQTAPRILQPSRGFAYTYDANGADNAKINAASIKINGVTIDPGLTYRVTVNSFLATGGDNFFVLKDGTNRLGGAVDLDALTEYFDMHSPVAPGLQNRITRLN